MSSTRVHNDDLKVFTFELLYALRGDHHRVHLCVTEHNTQSYSREQGVREHNTQDQSSRCNSPAVEGDSGFGGVLFQLIEGT